MSAATPIVIPRIEIKEIIVIKFTLCLETRYRLDMNDSKFIIEISMLKPAEF
jgi:hypothetical protein